jgi:hypothetical protein
VVEVINVVTGTVQKLIKAGTDLTNNVKAIKDAVTQKKSDLQTK